MSAFFRTLYFFYILLTKKPGQVVCEPRILTISADKNLQLDLYMDPHRRQFHGAILFIHGMNKLGNKDPRVIEICQALASCGYIALAPTYPQITQLIMENIHIDEIEVSIQAMLADRKLTPANKLAVFSASYSGAMALRSIARPGIGEKILAFCSIGSPSCPLNVFSTAFKEGGSPDLYAKMIILKNLLRFAKASDPILDQALNCAIDDNFEKYNQNTLAEFISQQTTEKQKQIHSIIDNLDNTQHYLEIYAHAIEEFNYGFVNSADFKNLHCHVALIHSETDEVFPAEETVNLYQELRDHQLPCRMLITPLLEHADYKFSLKQVGQIWQLISIFAYFFRYSST